MNIIIGIVNKILIGEVNINFVKNMEYEIND